MLIHLHAASSDIDNEDGRIKFIMPNIYLDDCREYSISLNALYILFKRPSTIECLGEIRSNLVDCSMANPLQELSCFPVKRGCIKCIYTNCNRGSISSSEQN